MCDFSGRLIAWMDRELPDDEAAGVEQHLRVCAECWKRVDAYEEVSRALLAYCDAATASKTRYRLAHWVPILSGAAAVAALVLVFLPPSVKQIPLLPKVAEVPVAAALETAPKFVKEVHRRHAAAPTRTPNTNWTAAEPDIQITIPAEAMFPPGAVPEGVNFIADLSIAADGSVQGLRLQP